MLASQPQPISRAEIARASGLSKPTVSSLIAEMEAAGLVRLTETVPPPKRSGRPATLYELGGGYRRLVAADIGATKTLIAVADLTGSILAEREIPTGPDARTALERFMDAAADMLAPFGGRCHGVCVGVPGIYRPAADRVEEALNLPGFDSLKLRSLLAERFSSNDEHIHLNIDIDNDVNLAALGELTRSRGEPGHSDFVTISVGTGIGMGIVAGGELHRGGTGSAGEIGSLLVWNPASATAPMILEDIASGPSICKQFGQALEDGCRSELDPSSDVPEILDAAERGDEAARRTLHHVARAMALAVSHVCHITDPTRVVFSGGAGTNPVFVDAVRLHVERLISRPPQVTASKLGRRAALIGAVSVALRSIRNNLVAQTLGGNRP